VTEQEAIAAYQQLVETLEKLKLAKGLRPLKSPRAHWASKVPGICLARGDLRSQESGVRRGIQNRLGVGVEQATDFLQGIQKLSCLSVAQIL
jgi:hypothetical protein